MSFLQRRAAGRNALVGIGWARAAGGLRKRPVGRGAANDGQASMPAGQPG